jgi:hypothetical protein
VAGALAAGAGAEGADVDTYTTALESVARTGMLSPYAAPLCHTCHIQVCSAALPRGSVLCCTLVCCASVCCDGAWLAPARCGACYVLRAGGYCVVAGAA